MHSDSAVVVDQLTREYATRQGTRRALDEVSFTVPYGLILGLLGPNGAGKTTCIRILTTLLLPTRGTARVAGADVVRHSRRVRRAVGVSFGGESGLYTRLSGRNNLRYFGTMYGMSGRQLERRADYLLARVGLSGHGRDRIESYSRGMCQRLHIARALIHDPPILLLDEPSSGIDPEHARHLRKLIMELRDEGRAIIVTTHDMLEAEQLCQDLIILNHGRVLRGMTTRALRSEAATSIGHRLEVQIRDSIPITVLNGVPGLVRYEEGQSGLLQVYTRDAAAATTFLLEKARDNVLGLQINFPTLEEAYLTAIGHAGT